MELRNLIETGGAILTVLGLRELIPWLIKRHANRGRTCAQIEKIRAETKSTEVETLSHIIKQLSGRIDALEQDVREIQAAERECQKIKRQLEDRLAELEREQRARAFAGIARSNWQGSE